MANEILLVNPRRRRRRRRKNPVAKANPRRRRRRARRRVSRRRRNPVAVANPRRRRYRRRRNPAVRLSTRSVMNQLTGAGTGALGAIGLDVLYGLLPIPVTWKAGMLAPIVKGGAAIGMGMLLDAVGFRSATAARMTEGALTVMLHDFAKPLIATTGIPMGAYLNSGYPATGLDAYLPDLSADDSFDADYNSLNEYDSMGEYLDY